MYGQKGLKVDRLRNCTVPKSKAGRFFIKYWLFDILKIEFCIVTSINFTETIHIGFGAYHCSSVIHTKIFHITTFREWVVRLQPNAAQQPEVKCWHWRQILSGESSVVLQCFVSLQYEIDAYVTTDWWVSLAQSHIRCCLPCAKASRRFLCGAAVQIDFS